MQDIRENKKMIKSSLMTFSRTNKEMLFPKPNFITKCYLLQCGTCKKFNVYY